jgi:hypothetical protein
MIALVHLIWGPLGVRPLRRFLDSYRLHPPGTDHELVVVMNGVEPVQLEPLRAELERVDHTTVTTAAPVQDLLAYRQAAEQLTHDRVCFVNSHSEIAAPGWLEKLDAALDQRRSGLAGATGSWASVRSSVLNSLFIPTPYRHAIPSRSTAARELAAIEAELARESDPTAERGAPRPTTPWVRIRNGFGALRLMPEQLCRFVPFPAYHVRTNGFIVERRLFASLRLGTVSNKMDAYALESGRESFTSQVLAQGLRALVVARDGTTYEHTRWPVSRTFWQGEQEGLMIADNQTRSYANGNIDRRRLLSGFAWGPEADPSHGARADLPVQRRV